MLSFAIPAGFIDTTEYRFLSKKRKREYRVSRTEGSAVATCQERRLLLDLQGVADDYEKSGHRAKLSTGKDGILVLKLKPGRDRRLGKYGKTELVILAAVKCFAPDLAVRLLAMSPKEDTKEFAAALKSMRRAEADKAARVRIEEAGDRAGKWRAAGPVELKLAADYQMKEPLTRLDRAGYSFEVTRFRVTKTARANTPDWPLCDKVDYDWTVIGGDTYYEIDEGPPGIVEEAIEPVQPESKQDLLKIVYTPFNKVETGELLYRIQESVEHR